MKWQLAIAEKSLQPLQRQDLFLKEEISRLVLGVSSAICNVNITEGECHVKTIAGKPPIGICGTGVIEAVCELFKEGIIDETGLLREEYFEDGYPLVYSNSSDKLVFTQKI